MTISNALNLEFPIEVHGKSVKVLELHRLTAGDLAQSETAIGGEDIAGRMASGGGLIPAAQMIVLVGLSARIPPSAARSLDASDFDAAADVVKGFLSRGKAPAGGAPALSA